MRHYPSANEGAEKRDVLDGALIGFVEGTDLEVVLLLQTRKDGKGGHWEYALARMSDHRLKFSLAEKSIWEVERLAGYDNPRAAYHCVMVESRISADEK